MRGSLNSEFVKTTLQTLEKRCLILLNQGYSATKLRKNITIDWKEEDISKELALCLKENKNMADWNIDIVPEYRIYKDDGIAAISAPRIDFRFSCWFLTNWEYFVEAKNLIEVDSSKEGRKTKISANYLHKRYISTGVDNFVSGKYPNQGCLVGYVLQGDIDNIISCLNNYLCNIDRVSEILKQHTLGFDELDRCYVSNHENGSIKHLMLDYTSY